jgi:hypothetical protein
MVMRRGLAAAAWQRLGIRTGPSPALERFLEWLAQTPYDWSIRADGKIRAHDAGTELCAITGVVRHRTGLRFDVGDWVRAGDLIGLSYADAGLVVEAADVTGPAGRRVKRMRARVLAAARLAGAASPLPRRPDPMDRALAELIDEGTEAPTPSPPGSPSPRRSKPRA